MFLLMDVMHVTLDRSMNGSSMNRDTNSACSSISSIASSPRERSDSRMPSPLQSDSEGNASDRQK